MKVKPLDKFNVVFIAIGYGVSAGSVVGNTVREIGASLVVWFPVQLVATFATMLLFAHWVDERDKALLREKGTGIEVVVTQHCPKHCNVIKIEPTRNDPATS